jgi:hypothetical protein
MCTYSAFKQYFPSTLAPGVMGRLLQIWQYTMIRREYSSKCVIDPQGTVTRIGDNMPETDRRLIRTSYTKYWQGVYTHQAQKFRAHMSSKTPNASKSRSDPDYILNGRTVRILNFGSTRPLLFFANSIHNAKVVSSRTSPVENPHIVKLRDEFNKGTEAGDEEFLHCLMVDIQRAHKESLSSPACLCMCSQSTI